MLETPIEGSLREHLEAKGKLNKSLPAKDVAETLASFLSITVEEVIAEFRVWGPDTDKVRISFTDELMTLKGVRKNQQGWQSDRTYSDEEGLKRVPRD